MIKGRRSRNRTRTKVQTDNRYTVEVFDQLFGDAVWKLHECQKHFLCFWSLPPHRIQVLRAKICSLHSLLSNFVSCAACWAICALFFCCTMQCMLGAGSRLDKSSCARSTSRKKICIRMYRLWGRAEGNTQVRGVTEGLFLSFYSLLLIKKLRFHSETRNEEQPTWGGRASYCCYYCRHAFIKTVQT